jgi:hypothetical protein
MHTQVLIQIRSSQLPRNRIGGSVVRALSGWSATLPQFGRVRIPRNPLAISDHKRLGSKSRFAAKYNTKMSNRKSKNPCRRRG